MTDSIVNTSSKTKDNGFGKQPDFSVFDGVKISHWELHLGNNIHNEDTMHLYFSGIPTYQGKDLAIMMKINIGFSPNGVIEMFIKHIDIANNSR